MLFAAYLPEIAAAAVALVAVHGSDKLRVPFARRDNCELAKQKAVAWRYHATDNGQVTWHPITREGSC